MLNIAKILKDNGILPTKLGFELRIKNINKKIRTRKETQEMNKKTKTKEKITKERAVDIKLEDLYKIWDYLTKLNIIPTSYDIGDLLNEV